MIDYYLDFINVTPPIVHSAKCKKLKAFEYQKHLGKYLQPEDALLYAKRYHTEVSLCVHCQKRN